MARSTFGNIYNQLYPTIEKRIEPPKDADTIQDRELDIRFHDKTKYDKKVAEMTTDYLILHGQIRNLALKYIDPFNKRKVKDLIEGRFDVKRVVYIDREDDQDTIFGKAADFSRETVVNLEKLGYNDAQNAIQEHADLAVSKEGSYKIRRTSRLS